MFTSPVAFSSTVAVKIGSEFALFRVLLLLLLHGGCAQNDLADAASVGGYADVAACREREREENCNILMLLIHYCFSAGLSGRRKPQQRGRRRLRHDSVRDARRKMCLSDEKWTFQAFPVCQLTKFTKQCTTGGFEAVEAEERRLKAASRGHNRPAQADRAEVRGWLTWAPVQVEIHEFL